jgi:glycosyltransferase involved in cell wall biosynthesis
MNICIIAHCYLPDVGGSVEVIRYLAREFTKKYNKVTIVVLTASRRLKAREVIEGIDTYRIRVPFPVLPRRGLKGTIEIFEFLIFLPSILIKLAKILKNSKSRIIHVHYIGINAFCTYCLSLISGLKYIVSLHGFNVQVLPFLKGIRGFVVRVIHRAILNRSSFVITCSKSFLNTAIERTPAIKNKSSSIFNGINIEEFNHNGKALINYPYILCLGRLDAPTKGFDLALLAFKDILDFGFEINLVLAGDGPDKEVYEEFTKLLGLEKKVNFFGLADRNQVVNLLKNCEFFVMPSRIEPFGIVNLEAMAAGKAVVASRTGGIPEVVEDKVTGLLVKPSDEKELARGMKSLLVDKALREMLGSNGRKKIENKEFSWEAISSKYIELYAKFL